MERSHSSQVALPVLGFATAERFIAEGAAHVFITARRQQALDEAVKKLGSKKSDCGARRHF